MAGVNAAILRWARETSGLDPESAARALGLHVDRLARIEDGEVTPAYTLLQKMVTQYKRPLVTFYLDQPPSADDSGHDFRTLIADRAPRDEARVAALVRDIKARQGLLRSAVEDDEDAVPVAGVGSMSLREGVEAVTSSICRHIKFDRTQYRQAKDSEQAFALLRAAVEKIGIYVLLAGDLGSHHSMIPVESFRGLAIADPLTPFIVINDKDAKPAWSFTLMHEVAHLWIGESGISAGFSDSAIEVFCNNVAGDFFATSDEFQRHDWSGDTKELLEKVGEFAKARHISKQLVLYRLFKFGVLSHQTWTTAEAARKEQWRQERARAKESRDAGDSGPSYYVVRRHRLGSALLDTVKRSLASGSLSTAKAAKVLGVNARAVQHLLEV